MDEIVKDIYSIKDFEIDKINCTAITLEKIKSSEDSYHCGIAYKIKNNINYIHLAFHCNLLNENMDNIDLTLKCIKPRINPYKQPNIAQMCRRVYERHKCNIPYGFLYNQSKFEKNGSLVLGDSEHGLTCSTFVLAIFESSGIKLVDIDNWPTRTDDIPNQQRLLNLLTKLKVVYDVSDKHIENIGSEVGCPRVRPEEVAVSSTFNPTPGKIEDIIDRARKIKMII